MKNIETVIEKNNELLKESIKGAMALKGRLQTELINNYSNELETKITHLDNEIKKAERLINCTPSEGHKIYAENHPENVDSKGDINEKGIKRFEFLRKRFGFSRFFK